MIKFAQLNIEKKLCDITIGVHSSERNTLLRNLIHN